MEPNNEIICRSLSADRIALFEIRLVLSPTRYFDPVAAYSFLNQPRVKLHTSFSHRLSGGIPAFLFTKEERYCFEPMLVSGDFALVEPQKGSLSPMPICPENLEGSEIGINAGIPKSTLGPDENTQAINKPHAGTKQTPMGSHHKHQGTGGAPGTRAGGEAQYTACCKCEEGIPGTHKQQPARMRTSGPHGIMNQYQQLIIRLRSGNSCPKVCTKAKRPISLLL